MQTLQIRNSILFGITRNNVTMHLTNILENGLNTKEDNENFNSLVSIIK